MFHRVLEPLPKVCFFAQEQELCPSSVPTTCLDTAHAVFLLIPHSERVFVSQNRKDSVTGPESHIGGAPPWPWQFVP